MRKRWSLIGVVVAGAALATAGVASADRGDHGKPFYFSANCTGLGDVTLSSIGLSRGAAQHVVGSNIVVVATDASIGGARGIESAPPAAGATCTFTGGGFSLADIQPFDEPFTRAVLITHGQHKHSH
jgi:hypothetical protein